MAPAPPLDFAVSRAGIEQLEEAWAIVDEYNRAVGVHVRDTRESFARSYFGASGGLWLARTWEGTVGCIALRPLALPQSFGPQPCGEVKRLYVQPHWRGNGIAQALLAELESYARSRSYRSLYLDTKEDLQTAIRFYLKQGFDPCERYNDNPQATLFMRKALD